MSLMPAGVGVAGASMVRGLRLLGLALPTAVLAVAVMRALTLGASVATGVAVLLWAAWRGELSAVGTQAHFEELSGVYDAEIPLHVREHLVDRKVELMQEILGEGGGLLGLDLGCGRGYYLGELWRRGYGAVGIDFSPGQLGAIGDSGRTAVADVLHLPFADGAFDFVYTVNVLHHLPSRQHQRRAFDEARRALRPGGIFFLHEINVTNPLFRLYMGYLFPLLRNIDLGTERWLLPGSLGALPGWRLRQVRYFTFVPDFLPRRLAAPAWKLERRLERSRWAPLSAHYMAVLEKTE